MLQMETKGSPPADEEMKHYELGSEKRIQEEFVEQRSGAPRLRLQSNKEGGLNKEKPGGPKLMKGIGHEGATAKIWRTILCKPYRSGKILELGQYLCACFCRIER